MTNPFDDPEGMYLVLVNAELQRSIWPRSIPVPAGWEVAHGPESREACLDFVRRTWTDMRPLSALGDRECPMKFPPREYVALDMDPMYAELRSQRRLFRVSVPYGDDAWLVTRWDDVKAVLDDPRFSRAAAALSDEARLTPTPIRTSILGMDPPEHTRLRRLLGGVFSGREVEKLKGMVTETAGRLIDEMIKKGPPADLVEQFVMPFSGLVICELLGVPFEDRDDFRSWLDAFSNTDPAAEKEIEASVEALYAYIAQLIARRRAEPSDDLVSKLVRAKDEEDKLTETELVEFISVLLIAGHDTVAAQLMNSIFVLLTHPEETERLRGRMETLPYAVEELLRFVPIDAHVAFARYATEDVELGGTKVRAGDALLLSLPSADRDAAVFDRPDELDLERKDNPHFGFGSGPHRCPGATLARVELMVATAALLERFPKLRLAVPERELSWRSGMLVRSLNHMPVTW